MNVAEKVLQSSGGLEGGCWGWHNQGTMYIHEIENEIKIKMKMN